MASLTQDERSTLQARNLLCLQAIFAKLIKHLDVLLSIRLCHLWKDYKTATLQLSSFIQP
jgi:hypothetical protein